MWTTDSNSTENNQIFIVRPNASLSRRGGLILFAWIAAVMLLIILRFALIGAWLVIPFTVLDVVFVGLALRYVLRKNSSVELIACTPEKITITRTDGKTFEEYDFQSFWAQVIVTPSRHQWYPSKLFLRSHGRYLEFGGCLTNKERKDLARAIKKSLEHAKALMHN